MVGKYVGYDPGEVSVSFAAVWEALDAGDLIRDLALAFAVPLDVLTGRSAEQLALVSKAELEWYKRWLRPRRPRFGRGGSPGQRGLKQLRRAIDG